jgi:hypothetical protein
MTADTTQTASDDDTPAACTICGEAVDTADRWTCCAPVLADGRWVCHGCDGQPSIPSVAVVTQ